MDLIIEFLQTPLTQKSADEFLQNISIDDIIQNIPNPQATEAIDRLFSLIKIFNQFLSQYSIEQISE
jgi:hypothetical protein